MSEPRDDLLRRGDVLDLYDLHAAESPDHDCGAACYRLIASRMANLPASPEAAALAAVAEAAEKWDGCYQAMMDDPNSFDASHGLLDAEELLRTRIAALASLRAAREGRTLERFAGKRDDTRAPMDGWKP